MQLATKTKMFCGCVNDNENTDPNTLVCSVCLGYPGTLPIINQKAIELAAKTAMVLDCEVRQDSRFDRKNYFYPDLPKGYQITQYFSPIGVNGKLAGVGIERVHIEEDTAKLVHAGKDSLIDFNRAGIPLLEIVSRPDITDSVQAGEYLKALKDVLVRGGYSKARMQLGEFRCDANISTLDEDGNQLGEVVEIKNLNSFRNVVSALNYEHQRQVKELKSGQEIIKETRGFDVKSGQTVSQRVKEKAHDYRYFPEPDLPPVRLSAEVIEKWRGELEISADDLKKILMDKYHLTDKTADFLVRYENNELREFLFELVDTGKLSREEDIYHRAIMYIIEDLWVEVKKGIWSKEILLSNLDKLLEVINQFSKRKIDKLTAKNIIGQGIIGGKNIDLNNLNETDESNIENLLEEFLTDNPDQIEIYKNPEKQKAVENFFIGFVKRRNQGRGEVDKIISVFRRRFDGK